MKIDTRASDIITRFNQYTDWEDRYKELINLGRKAQGQISGTPDDKYLVKGCQSQVWLIPEYSNGRVYFTADSDASIVKGIVLLLVQVYSDSTPMEILNDKSEFLSKIGITEHLSMNRTNGLASMLKQIKMYAMVYQSLADKGISDAP